MKPRFALFCLTVLAACAGSSGFAVEDPPLPTINQVGFSNSQATVTWTPYPAAEQYRLLSTGGFGYSTTLTWASVPGHVYRIWYVPGITETNWRVLHTFTAISSTSSFSHIVSQPSGGFYLVGQEVNPGAWQEVLPVSINRPAPTGFAEAAGQITGSTWSGPSTAPAQFYKLEVAPMAGSNLLAATVLHRLTYGPSPEDIARISSIGPAAYIAEQIAPWSIIEEVAATHANISLIENKFAQATSFVYDTNASISDFRAWHILRAVGARRQFLEVLLQFLENHFVTQYQKSKDWFATYYDNGALEERLAAQFEYLELQKWRNALLHPQCTFVDLLKISAESPAMIIYLDTVSSRGDSGRIANENYARELLELFTFGVDSGYDQDDITVMSRAWTGWTIEKVDFANAFNPFSSATTNIIPGSTNTSTTTRSNLFGTWVFNYRSTWHNSSAKYIFPGKTIPARYGPPWAGRSYELILNHGSGTNGIQDGYQVLAHLANQPFTQEYISIKLCRLLVHDAFPHPSLVPGEPGYTFYDYASTNLTAEAQLVHDCMLAWEAGPNQGSIWSVIQTIVDSDLFKSHSASRQKIKTPFELAVSAVRALRSSTNGSHLAGSFTAYTDGYNLGGTSATGTSPLTRMGDMWLFDREAPDGYPEAGGAWISAGTLAERLRFLQALCIAPGQSGHSDAGDANTAVDPGGLLRTSRPSSSWTNATAAADFFVSLLFPGEGTANLNSYRDAAVDFLNDGSTDTPPNTIPFGNLAVSDSATSAYDQRLRGMVGFLLTTQRFQEQ